MLKSLFVVLLVGFSLSFSKVVRSQETQSTWLTLSFNGFIPKVFEFENKTAAELYENSKEWAKTYYPNIKKELIYDSLNYKIKVRSNIPEAFYCGLKRNLYDVDYTFIISFKDGKYRVQVELNSFYYNARNVKYRSEGDTQETGWDQKFFYSSEKEINPKTSPGHSELTYSLYKVSTSLFEAMKEGVTPKEEKDDDDW